MLTERQQDTLDFIRNYIQSHGRSPLVAEIAKGLGISSQGTTHRYIQALVDAGLMERHVGRTRGLVLVKQSAEQQHELTQPVILPVMGKIAAGRLIEAVADETEIDLSEMFSGKDRFVLKVNGDSMIDKAIMSGDWVVVQSQPRARNGEIVVALVDGYDATLKTLLINDDGTVTLMPANADYEPITLSSERVRIQGVVVGQLRTYP
ncbi:MAG: transcriptional repressor LexA [Proteobacteria bacterium]|nr:transcriptional repressor LexA [Pseudomonadota bacterium]